jgi:hypothetical protein
MENKVICNLCLLPTVETSDIYPMLSLDVTKILIGIFFTMGR